MIGVVSRGHTTEKLTVVLYREHEFPILLSTVFTNCPHTHNNASGSRACNGAFTVVHTESVTDHAKVFVLLGANTYQDCYISSHAGPLEFGLNFGHILSSSAGLYYDTHSIKILVVPPFTVNSAQIYPLDRSSKIG